MQAVSQYPRRHLVSANEYLRMTEAGVFCAEARLELMDGEIIEMAPIGSRHAAVVSTLGTLLVRAAGERAILWMQNPIVVGEQSVPQPDLALLRPRADRYFESHPNAADVLLAIEVSDTSLQFDLERKVPLYGCAGIPEVWVIDLANRELHAFSAPDTGGSYQSKSLAVGRQRVELAALREVAFSVAQLFPGT